MISVSGLCNQVCTQLKLLSDSDKVSVVNIDLGERINHSVLFEQLPGKIKLIDPTWRQFEFQTPNHPAFNRIRDNNGASIQNYIGLKIIYLLKQAEIGNEGQKYLALPNTLILEFDKN